MAHLSSCREVFTIEHTASTRTVFVWLVLPFRKGRISYGLVKNVNIVVVLYLQICTTQNYVLFQISASGLFLKFRKFQPRCSYKMYSHKKECIALHVLICV